MSTPARAAAALAWFGTLALVYGIVLGPGEGGSETGENLLLAGFLLAAVAAGALFGLPALIGPPAGVLLLMALYAGGVELPVFVSSALWAVGAVFLAAFELFGACLGIAGRAIHRHRRRRRDTEADPAYNPAP